MPNIGDFRFPRYGFDDALENIEILVKELNSQINNQENFAQAIGHKNANSGAYKKKRADLKKFGLVDNNYEATDLGRDIVHPKSDEAERRAKFQALQNIDLLHELYEYTGGKPAGEDFWIKVSEVADTTPGEAKNHADKVKKLYSEMLDYEPQKTTEGTEESSGELNEASNKNIQSPSEAPEDVKLRLIDADGNKFDVREEKDLPVAKAFFESRISEIEQGEE
ncbi:hypothetical protein AQV86_02585 [Nanohaloarchaea archaeon SG9]|nr:hypothetical protein AQV86_02585 [Nanohaloarchaea archaeon SG9]